MTVRPSTPAHAMAVIVALGALLVLFAGTLVNSNQAALSVPDWPLSYGKLILDEWRGNTVYEQSHRVAAAGEGLLLIGLVFIFLRSAVAGWLLRWMWIAAALYLAQVLIGGAVVLMHDPPWLGSLHLVMAQLFFVLTVVLAMGTSAGWVGSYETAGRPLDPGRLGSRHGRLLRVTLALLTLQILLGGLTRRPPAGEALFVGTLLAHVALGLALVVMIPMVAASLVRGASSGGLRRTAYILMATMVLQFSVGAILFIISPEPFDEPWPPPAGFPLLHGVHVVLGSLLLALAACLHHAVGRRLR